jgi:hypothetical protein
MLTVVSDSVDRDGSAAASSVNTAAHAERRRLERDLHDGAQQHLVALAVLIQLARTSQGNRTDSLLAEASALLRSAGSPTASIPSCWWPGAWPKPCAPPPNTPPCPCV